MSASIISEILKPEIPDTDWCDARHLIKTDDKYLSAEVAFFPFHPFLIAVVAAAAAAAAAVVGLIVVVMQPFFPELWSSSSVSE